MTVDASGNTYIAGYRLSSTPTISFDNITLQLDSIGSFIAKISNTGNWLWARLLAAGTGGSDFALTVDQNNRPVVAGAYYADLEIDGLIRSGLGNGFYMIHFNSNGQAQSLNTTTSSNNLDPFKTNLTNLDKDKHGNLYLSGCFGGTAYFGTDTLSSFSNGMNQFVAKLNTSGQWLWGQEAKNLFSYQNVCPVTSPKGTTYSLGGNNYSNHTIFGNDTIADGNYDILYQIDSSGNHSWQALINSAAYGTSCSYDKNGNVIVSGSGGWDSHFGQHQVSNSVCFISKLQLDGILSLNLPNDTMVYCADSTILQPRHSTGELPTYKWSPSYGLSDPDIQFPTAFPDTTTIYTVIATTKTGCTDTASIKVVPDSTAAGAKANKITFVTSTGNSRFCDNTNISISTKENFLAYYWSTGSTSSSISPKKPGTYKLTVQDSSGCYRTSSITLNPPAQIQSASNLICRGDSISLFVNTLGLDSLRWNTGANSAQLKVKQPGTYWVSVYKGTCTYTDTMDVILFTDTANASFSSAINGLTVDFTPNSVGINNGYWNFGDGTYKSGKSITHTYASPGTYSVCYNATDICGHSDKYCTSVAVTDIELEEVKAIQTFSIYPNPANDILNISSNEILETTLVIYNISGGIVTQKPLAKNDHWQLDISQLPPGYYFIRIGSQASRFVKL